MKKNDIIVLTLIASVTLLITYFSGQALIGNKTSKPEQVETVEKLSTEVAEPQATVFHSNAINPTVKIRIGNSTNRQPFGN